MCCRHLISWIVINKCWIKKCWHKGRRRVKEGLKHKGRREGPSGLWVYDMDMIQKFQHSMGTCSQGCRLTSMHASLQSTRCLTEKRLHPPTTWLVYWTWLDERHSWAAYSWILYRLNITAHLETSCWGMLYLTVLISCIQQLDFNIMQMNGGQHDAPSFQKATPCYQNALHS